MIRYTPCDVNTQENDLYRCHVTQLVTFKLWIYSLTNQVMYSTEAFEFMSKQSWSIYHTLQQYSKSLDYVMLYKQKVEHHAQRVRLEVILK